MLRLQDASKIKAATVLALKSARAAVDPSVPTSGQNIVIQTPEESLPACRTEPRTPTQSDQGLRPVHINGNRDITRLVAQTAIQVHHTAHATGLVGSMAVVQSVGHAPIAAMLRQLPLLITFELGDVHSFR